MCIFMAVHLTAGDHFYYLAEITKLKRCRYEDRHTTVGNAGGSGPNDRDRSGGVRS